MGGKQDKERHEKGTTFELDLEGISKQAKMGLIKWEYERWSRQTAKMHAQ